MEKDEFKDIDLSAEKKKVIRDIIKINPDEITKYSSLEINKPEETTITKKDGFWERLSKIFK